VSGASPLRRKKSSPSRVRFRPPPPLTFRFRVEPSETASTYSRPLLGASGTLGVGPGRAQELLDATVRKVRTISFRAGPDVVQASRPSSPPKRACRQVAWA
jgi:hypothetical protein